MCSVLWILFSRAMLFCFNCESVFESLLLLSEISGREFRLSAKDGERLEGEPVGDFEGEAYGFLSQD